ncbi:MAG: small subunit ribosomal protein S1 [Gammaproteobacteria bacterium]|nr:MAG: small subunit ribosomal protein S1 [Gammaproteobacteria bacterium]TND07047.1 MAG: small subunit ribosomal protein S1 [Gammaproteobacteria bacterium]
MSESFAELFEQSHVESMMRPGALVIGTVVKIANDSVMVNAGLKSESIIPIEQFRNERGIVEVQVGDTVEVALETVEDGFGETKLSREKAKRAKLWTMLEESMEKGSTVTGIITGKVKGGFTVDIGEIRAFLPGSLVDVRPVRDTTYLEGKELDFKVVKLDRKRNNVVVSRRAVVEKDTSAEREALLETLEEGQIVKGYVKNLTDYGAFIDLGGVDGLLHITDMAWKRVKQPSEIVNVGDEIEVKVLKFDKERKRVSLGLKQLGDDPWQDLARRYPVNTRLYGKVTNIADYGCFVEIENGVEGLVHMSEMDWTNRNVHPSKIVSVGDEVEVMVLDIDESRRRISLGMKQCQMNPWEEFAATNKKGDSVKGSIKSITDFGIFVGLPGNIDGLLHLSDLSWSEPGEDAVRKFSKGDEIEAVILAIDPERERISLGIKQLEKDPFTFFVADHAKGSIVKGTVSEVDIKGAVIDLAGGVTGNLSVVELSRERVDDARTVLKVGDEVEAKFVAIDRKNRTIVLSIKAKDDQEEAEAVQGYRASEGGGMTTLGDLLKEQMENKNT